MFFEERYKIFKEHRVINWHDHVWYGADGNLDVPRMERLIDHAAVVGIDMTVISLPLVAGFNTPEMVERANDTVYSVLKRYPNVTRGFAYIDPIMGKKTVEREIRRCVEDLGFIGVKLYHQFYMDEPEQYPVIETCIDLDIPILMHAAKCDEGIHLTNAQHMINAARRYPEATFQMAHIGGGGDWYWQLKGVEDVKNLYIDIAGSVHDSEMVERTVKVFGAERVLFACDMSYSSSVGKILSADITEEELKIILDNPHFARYLDR